MSETGIGERMMHMSGLAVGPQPPQDASVPAGVDPAWLLDFSQNVYSQFGEDGVIEKVLETIPNRDGWCVEFGAWDGQFLSNTRNLIDNKAYAAVLIEADADKFRELCSNYKHNPKVLPVNRFVGFEPAGSLDSILRGCPIPKDFDFLSIDIDGNDYHAWKAVSEYRPKVVCVEYNPTIPTSVDFVQPADESVSQGCSLLALVKLGKEKGYELVSVLNTNAFFVRAEDFPFFRIADNRPETLRKDQSRITYIFTGYDGRVFLSGYRALPWHQLKMLEPSIQQLPRFLQRYPDNYSALQRRAFRFWRRLRKLSKFLPF
ncbi:MAG TPA: hypothetical protein PK280_11970 [Planctomycetota bacterium]|nr:hypothetical protein [Planctomycetota bacterium]